MDWLLVMSGVGAGALAAVNPCGFAMLPAYIGYFLNRDEADRDRPLAVRTSLARALLVGATTAAGFVSLSLVVGVLISLGAHYITTYVPWAGLLMGSALVFLGIWVLTGHHIAVPVFSIRYKRSRTLPGFFLFGLAYGLASLTCTLPLFLAVIGSTFATAGILQAVAQFAAYAVGMTAIMIALTISLALFKGGLATRLRRVLPYVGTISGVLLLLAGGYIVYYWIFRAGVLRSLLPG